MKWQVIGNVAAPRSEPTDILLLMSSPQAKALYNKLTGGK